MVFRTVHDNTAFTSVGIWATGQSNDTRQAPFDLASVLDLACSFVLSDQIVIPGFVHAKVAAERELGREYLGLWGLDIGGMEVVGESEDPFRKRQRDLGYRIFCGIDIAPEEAERYLRKPRTISKAEESHALDIHGLLFHPERSKILSTIIEHPFEGDNRKFGAAGYTIATTEGLVDFFDRYKSEWNLQWTQRLLDQMMLEKNHMFASDNSGAYSPNYKRSLLVADGFLYRRVRLMDSIKEKLNEMVNGFAETIPLPGLARVLVIKSKGSPDRLWEEVLRMREKASGLRNRLSKANDNIRNDDASSGWKDLERDVDEYSQELKSSERELMIKGASVQGFVFPSLDFSISEMGKKWRIRGFEKELSIISEITATSLSPVVEEAAFAELLTYGRRNLKKNS